MKSFCKVSIIIPVFNVESYIYECLESLKNQTYQNFELIIVDDGSRDNSLNIIKSFMKINKDMSIYLIVDENHGVAHARNQALKHAKGDFIMFIDPDDYVSPVFVEDLLKGIESSKADIAICDFVKVFEADNNRELVISLSDHGDILYSGSEVAILMLEGKVGGYLCNKIFRRENLITNNFYLEEGIHMEDLFPVFKEILRAQKVYYCSKPLYYYRQRKGSAVYTNTWKNIDDYNYVKCCVVDYALNHGIEDKYIEKFKISSYSMLIQMFYELGQNDKKLYRTFKSKGYNRLAPKILKLIRTRDTSTKVKIQIISWKLHIFRFIKNLGK